MRGATVSFFPDLSSFIDFETRKILLKLTLALRRHCPMIRLRSLSAALAVLRRGVGKNVMNTACVVNVQTALVCIRRM